MRFDNLTVTKTKENYFYLEWEFLPNIPPPTDPGSVDDYKFQIHWAKDPASGFLPVLDDFSNPIEIDGAVGPLEYTHRYEQYDFAQDHYYKILAINKSNPTDQFFSLIVFTAMVFDGVHDTMRYAEEILYNYYDGEPCIILKRKSFGTRCPECWMPERQQRSKSHCDTCKGTGFVAGFYQPIHAQISFDSDPKKSDLQKEWENVYDTKRARLSNYPIVRPKDLIINLDDDKRYVITHVETTKLPKLSIPTPIYSKQNFIISQLLTLEEINTDDNEYKIDIENITPIPITDEGNTGGTLPDYRNHRYYGVNVNTSLTNAQILALNKETCDARANTHEYDCSGGKYIWICYPARFGLARFSVNGFITTFDLTVQSVTNESSYIEPFNCYKSFRLQHGLSITVVVT